MGRHVEAFLGLPSPIHKAVVEAYIQGALAGEIADEDVAKLVTPWLSDAGQVSIYRQFAQADERYTAEIEPMFGDIRCPVAILWGEADPWIPVEHGRNLHDFITQSTFDTLPGIGHLPQLEAPQHVVDFLLSFLGNGDTE